MIRQINSDANIEEVQRFQRSKAEAFLVISSDHGQSVEMSQTCAGIRGVKV